MSSVTFNHKTYSLDQHGFLDPPEQWDENFAQGMARSLGIFAGLTEAHWRIIRYLRHKFLEEKTVPVIVLACAQNNMRLSEFRELFPTGYHRGACKIAGINYKFMYQANYWLTYETTLAREERYPLDPLGFLLDFRKWDGNFPEFMLGVMETSGTLTARHMEILKYLRKYYEQHRNIPTVYETCNSNSLTLEELHGLFPAGYRRGACRLAGLPFFT